MIFLNMINVIKRKKFISDDLPSQMCNDVQYFGEDVFKADVDEDIKKLILDSINKDCITSDGDKGIIIGFEDSSSFNDYYFIIYCPKAEDIVYELINSDLKIL